MKCIFGRFSCYPSKNSDYRKELDSKLPECKDIRIISNGMDASIEINKNSKILPTMFVIIHPPMNDIGYRHSTVGICVKTKGKIVHTFNSFFLDNFISFLDFMKSLTNSLFYLVYLYETVSKSNSPVRNKFIEKLCEKQHVNSILKCYKQNAVPYTCFISAFGFIAKLLDGDSIDEFDWCPISLLSRK